VQFRAMVRALRNRLCRGKLPPSRPRIKAIHSGFLTGPWPQYTILKMPTPRAPFWILLLYIGWVAFFSYRAATTWLSYPVDDNKMAIARPISYENADKCIEGFGRSQGNAFDHLCGRGCLRKSDELPNHYSCLEQSLNGAPVTNGDANYISLIAHIAFPFLL
jgi:hypothetical protein